jgi:hypothetical protein
LPGCNPHGQIRCRWSSAHGFGNGQVVGLSACTFQVLQRTYADAQYEEEHTPAKLPKP